MSSLSPERLFCDQLEELLDNWARTDALTPAAICGLMAMQIRILQDQALDRQDEELFGDGDN